MNTLIKETLDKVSENRKIYENGEYAVRDHLINPILNYLGWNTSNPKFVIPNLTTVDRDIPDYTLFKNGMKILFVEAKNLSVDLKNEIQQLARYCYNEGTEFGILDNAWQNFLNNPDYLSSKFVHIFKDTVDGDTVDTEFQDEEIEFYLKLRFRELIVPKTQCYENETLNQVRSTTLSINKKKSSTPSPRHWIKNIPELSRRDNLNSWKDICDHLGIEVGRDSARRALERWVKENKPSWPEIPEP
jgi:hypothetical protein